MNKTLKLLARLGLVTVLTSLAAFPIPAANVTGPELVFQTGIVASNGLTNFPDGNLAWRWPPTVGRAHPILYGSAGGVMGRLDIPTVAAKCPKVQGLPSYYTYAAGGGAILTNPLDAGWLCVAHLERKANVGGFWGALGLIVSYDYGQSWSWLGVIVEPSVPFTDPLPTTMEIGGGSTVLAGEYLYCYYRETMPNLIGRACMAYAKAYDVYRAAQQGQVSQWKKWDGGAIPNANGPPATGKSNVGAQQQGLPAEEDWCSCVYIAGRPGWFMKAICPFAVKKISCYRSNDGLSWTPMFGGQPITTEAGFHYYPSLIGLNPDTTFVTFDQGEWIWLYYLVSVKDPFDWTDAKVYRRKVFPN